MEPLKIATDWAKAEVFSTSLFILVGVIFLFGSVAFWYLGKTEFARAYVIPTLVAGSLLLIIGLGLTYTNIARVGKFKAAYEENTVEFVESEISRSEKTLQEYRVIVFKAIPFIIAMCAMIIAFVETPVWRASSITTLAMMTVILLIDGTAHARIKIYYEQMVDASGAIKADN